MYVRYVSGGDPRCGVSDTRGRIITALYGVDIGGGCVGSNFEGAEDYPRYVQYSVSHSTFVPYISSSYRQLNTIKRRDLPSTCSSIDGYTYIHDDQVSWGRRLNIRSMCREC